LSFLPEAELKLASFLPMRSLHAGEAPAENVLQNKKQKNQKPKIKKTKKQNRMADQALSRSCRS
jgi:hypothetical protein